MQGDPLTFWTVFFQMAAGIVLLFRRDPPRLPVRILGVILLLNAGVTAIWFHGFWPPWDDGRRIAAALDAPSEVLLYAFLASLSARPWARRATTAFLGLAVAAAVLAPFMYPHPATPLSTQFEQFRSVVFFVGLGLVSFRLAGGAEPWQRWAALAFLPRALYWTTTGSFGVGSVLGGTGLPKDTLLLATVPFLAMTSGMALARLLRRPQPPSRLAALLVPLSGVAIAVAEFTIRGLQPVDPVLIPMLSLLTLGVHRPLFLLVALAPGMLAPVAGRSLLAAVVGAGALLGLGAAYPAAPEASVLVGFVSGAMALAVLEVLAPRLETWNQPPAAAGPPPPGAPPPPATLPAGLPAAVGAMPAGPLPEAAPGVAHAARGAPPAAIAAPWDLAAAPPAMRRPRGRPQWQELLLALRGSCLDEGQAPRGDPHLTQKALVERTGIRASRISTLVRELNDDAAVRLDTHLPGWRTATTRGADAVLLHQFRGNVPGFPGVWVYYRLSPLGERLAAALAAEDAGDGPSPSPSQDGDPRDAPSPA